MRVEQQMWENARAKMDVAKKKKRKGQKYVGSEF
jgi:hypothetical protein